MIAGGPGSYFLEYSLSTYTGPIEYIVVDYRHLPAPTICSSIFVNIRSYRAGVNNIIKTARTLIAHPQKLILTSGSNEFLRYRVQYKVWSLEFGSAETYYS